MSEMQTRKKNDDPLMSVIEPALKVGALTGGVGFLIGGTSGILKGTTPALFATASAIQTFCLGTLFWSTRGGLLQAWNTQELRSDDYTKASALAGGFSGGIIGLVFRGRRNVIPGALVMAGLGAAGQAMSNWRLNARSNASREVTVEPAKKSTWFPLQRMTNEEYADMLREKLLKVDVEISILDDKIAALRKEQAELPTSKEVETSEKP